MKCEHLKFHDKWTKSAEEDCMTWLRAPDQPLNGPYGEIVLSAKFKFIYLHRTFHTVVVTQGAVYTKTSKYIKNKKNIKNSLKNKKNIKTKIRKH